MQQFDVSTDSTADLYKEIVKKRNIWFAPLTFMFEKNGEIEEHLDDFNSYGEYLAFYEKVRQGYMPKTSKLNYESHLAHFTKMAEAGVKDVLHFSISSGLANTVELAVRAGKEVKEKYPDFNLYSVDPLHATVGQGMLVGLAADCRDKGMSAKDTYDYLTEAKLRLQCCIIPNDLFYLQKGGRVSKVAAVFGTALSIKPVIVMDSFGKLSVIDKVRGMKKAYGYTLEKMGISGLDDTKKITVVHTDNEQGANELAEMIEKTFSVKPEIQIMGPSIGAHVGPGAVACAWMSKITRKELTGL